MPDKVKKIICLQGKHDSGKTKTLKKVCKIILEKYKKINKDDYEFLVNGNDIVIIIKNVKKRIIAISSGGDTWQHINQWNTTLAEKECDIIFCACRSRGKTVEQVKKMKRKGYIVEFVLKERESVETKFLKANIESANELLKKAGL